MDVSSAKWLSELGMDEYDIFHQCNMDSLTEFTGEQDIATALGLNGDFNQSFSSESYSSYTTNFNETSQARFARPSKQTKTNSWNSSTITDHVSVSPISSPTSQFLSFGPSSPNVDSLNAKYETASSNHVQQHLVSDNSLDSQNNAIQPNNNRTKRPYSNTKTPAMTKDHILAERKRREKLSQRFIALSAIVPGLKKMDKASVLGDAIKYVKDLQERVNILEEQNKKRTVESVVFVKKSQIYTDDESSSICDDDNSDSTCDAAHPEIEARASDKDVLIRIHFQKQKGLLPKIFSEVEKLQLSIVNSSVLPFGNSTLDLTIISQKNDDFKMTMKDFVKELRQSLLKSM